MAKGAVQFPLTNFVGDNGKPLFNAKIYIGEVDKNPRTEEFRKSVFVPQESGADIEIAQPVRTNEAGIPTYNGNPVELLVDGEYSMAVYSRNDVLEYYFPNASSSENKVIKLDTIDELRNTEPTTDLQQVSVAGHTLPGIGGGIFYADFSDTTSTDDDGITIVTPGGKRWIRDFQGDINAAWFGMVGGEVCGDILNSAINAAFVLGVNAVRVPNLTEPALLDKDVFFKQATKLVGDGFNGRLVVSSRTGATIKRSVANVGFIIDGESYGERIRWPTIKGLSIDGGGLDGTLIDITTAQNLLIEDCVVFGSSDRAWHLKNTFDCWFYNCYFQTSGNATTPATHLDDSTGSNSSHNNNIRFVGVTWEGNNGVPLRIDGEGTGPGNTQIAFDSRCKLENLGINTYQIVMIDCGSVVFNRSLLVSQGVAGPMPAQVYAENVRNIQGHFDVAHNSGGGTLAAVVEFNGVSRSSFKLWPAEANVIDGLSGSNIFDNSKGSFDARVELSSEYMGSKSLVNNNSTQSRFQPLGLDTPGATQLRLRRNGGTDANTSVHFDGGSSGDIYAGKNGSGEFVVATSADLGGTALFKVDRNGVPSLGQTQLTVGAAGAASSLPTTPSGYVQIEIGTGLVVVPYYNVS